MPFHDLEVAWPRSFSHLRYTESAKRFPPNLFTIAVSVIPPEFLFQLKSQPIYQIFLSTCILKLIHDTNVIFCSNESGAIYATKELPRKLANNNDLVISISFLAFNFRGIIRRTSRERFLLSSILVSDAKIRNAD